MKTTLTYGAALLGVAGLFGCSSTTKGGDIINESGGAMTGGSSATGATATETGGMKGTGATGGIAASGGTGGLTVGSGGIGGLTGGTGGAFGSGGTASGGVIGSGGINASGGVNASGGTSGMGGRATGGVGTGGRATGGVGTGGGTTGGAGTGGGGVGTGGGDTGGAETGGGGTTEECVLPDLPDLNSLPRNDKLPDPFTFFNGDPVTAKAQWECRRREIQAMAAKYIYGPYPFEPDKTEGTVSGGNVSITCTEGSKTENFTASISGTGDIITLDMGSGILPSGKRISFGAGFENKIKSLFGLSEMNTNVATGWMVDRVLDVLEQHPDSGHDPTKMVVSGCSGCGKGAFLVGVFSRIPMTVIVESGGGGAANLRQAEWFRHGAGDAIWQCQDAKPQSIDNLEDNGICGPWVTSAASQLRQQPAKVYNLPFDQHLLLATMAPRYLLHFSNNNGVNSWCHLGGTCEALSSWAAKPVWKALGVPERMGFHMYSSGHCGRPAEATSLANEFFKRAFQGDTSAKTDVMDIQNNGVQQPVSEWESMWIDWDMNTVLQ